MKHLVFAYPGDITTPTGGYGYDRRILEGLTALGWMADLLPLGDGFPFPAEETCSIAEAALLAAPKNAPLLVDGLAFGVLPDAAAKVASDRDVIALVHHPLCQENGLGSETAQALKISEESALKHVAHVVVTSPATAHQVRALFAIPAEKITVIEPGTVRVRVERRKPSDMVRLLSVGTIVPRKGYDLLFSALSESAHLDWHLDIVGDTTRDPDCFTDLTDLLDALGLANRVAFHGAVAETDLTQYYAAADIFVLASRYEGYGMAYMEALAHGLPVVGSGGGAVRDTLDRGGTVYCGVEDVASLAQAMQELLSDRKKREALSVEARHSAATLPTWEQAALKFAEVLGQFEQGGQP
ncbi:glycosyltransferase family 4 protein [Roseibium sp. RKSG952]|uniref:glycosyltransferase family 4 protein n=1 Tax=Roseibium sp. RKSG952 TaxID=2529384 RepID=UPI0012BD148B|nr:glycosyltransferase family 4 protein [Roseibium sp. RKSG952]MTI00010.1 glycosyltransferase family 1 protein [Roseibium sp. RKSG952]